MGKTKISWADETWNPVSGCSKVSEGCRHCYAETLSKRFGLTQLAWTANNAAENIKLRPDKLDEPRKLRNPSKIFVNSMSDLFHEQVPDDFLAQVFRVMVELPQHTFQILTKRPERAAAWAGPWPENVFMGTSVENRHSLSRLDALRGSKAQTLFVSFEPLLEDLGALDLAGHAWAIVGGESGKGFRSMPHAWARSIRDQCNAQGVAFFFKQSAAYKTEVGGTLQHEDGTFWTWHQYPYKLVPPEPGEAHKYTYAQVETSKKLF